MATHARQQYFADESSLSKEKREFSIADGIQEKIDSVEEGAQVNKIETVKVNGTALVPDANKAVNVDVPEVIDNLYTVAADDALSAKQGKLLYDYIQNLQTIGRFLSNWDSATGLPITNPSESPYLYKAGDYYRVSNVAVSPALNYKPDGSSFIIGQASTTVETNNVNISDLYLYDGTTWILLSNSGSSIAVDSSLSTTSTNPVENRVITNAINGKQNTLIAGTNIQIAADGKTISATDTTYSAGANISIDANNEISAVDTTYTAGTNVQISNQNVISATDTKYTAGTGINIDANNVISNTQTSAEWGNITGTLSDQTDLQNALDAKQDDMVILKYGISTWSDFITAYNKNAVVYCRASSSSNPASGAQTRLAFMAYVNQETNPTSVEFQYYRSRSDHNTQANQLDQVFVYTLTSASGGTWSVTERNTGAKAVAGTGINLAFGSGNMTISADTSVLATQTDLNSKANAADLNVKFFELASPSDLTTAQDIYDWFNAGNYPIVKNGRNIYVDGHIDINTGNFKMNLYRWVKDYNMSSSYLYYQELTFVLSSDTVTSVTSSPVETGVEYLDVNENYPTPYTPQYDGSPATKKYVDDNVGDKIEYVTQVEYNALPSSKLTDNKHYFIYSTSGGGGWQPGANTLAYWKFDDSLDDEMGNYNGTNNGATITYSALPGDSSVKYANISATGNNGVNLPSSIWLEWGTQQTSFTFAGFFKMTSVSSGFNWYTEASGSWAVTEFGCGDWNSQQSIRLCTGNGGWQEDTCASTLTDDTWYSLVRTYDHTTRTKSYYVNGVLLGSVTASLDYVTSSSLNKSILGRGYNGGISNCVFETNTVWTAQDVSNFHDTFKSLYGIS